VLKKARAGGAHGRSRSSPWAVVHRMAGRQPGGPAGRVLQDFAFRRPAGRVLQDFAFRDPTAATTIYNRVRPHPTSGREIALRFVLLRLQSASPKNPRTLPGGTLPPPTSWRRRLWQAGSEGQRPSLMTPSPSPATCRACRRSAAGARRRLLPPTSA
jgi:hypothetical protein